jgi:hypothetical protein
VTRKKFGPEPFWYPSGRVASGLPVKIFHSGTDHPAPVYPHAGESLPCSPASLCTDSSGQVQFFAAPGSYDIEVQGVRFAYVIPADPGEPSPAPSPGEGIPGPKGDKGDSVTAGSAPPTTIIPGVSVFIDAVSGDVYVYEGE